MPQNHWTEIRFRPNGGGPWYPDAFRKFLASKLENRVSPRLFWRGEDGKPLPGSPDIVFIGSRNWVGLRAWADAAASSKPDAVIALESALEIARCLDAEFGGKHALDIVQGERAIEPKNRAVYHIRKLALPRKRTLKEADALADLARTKGVPLGEAHLALAKEVILAGLRETFPDEAPLFINGLTFLSTPTWGTPVSLGGALNYIAQDIQFALPHRVVGPVQVGALRSRGFGDLRQPIGGGA